MLAIAWGYLGFLFTSQWLCVYLYSKMFMIRQVIMTQDLYKMIEPALQQAQNLTLSYICESQRGFTKFHATKVQQKDNISTTAYKILF
jgi:hypothetical protein